MSPIEQANHIAVDYTLPNSLVDSGNLYWALSVALNHIKSLEDRIRAIEADKAIMSHTIDVLEDRCDELASDKGRWFRMYEYACNRLAELDKKHD